MQVIDINMLGRAISQYTNFPFTEYANGDDKVLAIGPDGLYQLDCADNDNGKSIDAHFQLGYSDFNISNPKKIRYYYFGFESDGDLIATAYADEKLIKKYKLPAHKTGQQRTRVTGISVGKASRGRYWSIKIANTNGCDFAMDDIDVRAYILNEGFI